MVSSIEVCDGYAQLVAVLTRPPGEEVVLQVLTRSEAALAELARALDNEPPLPAATVRRAYLAMLVVVIVAVTARGGRGLVRHAMRMLHTLGKVAAIADERMAARVLAEIAETLPDPPSQFTA